MEDEAFLTERLILRVGNLINNIRVADLREADLTPAQSETILFYASHPGANIRALAESLQISHQAARKLVDKLQAKGILEILFSREDRRTTRILLTKEGVSICQALKQGGALTGERILQGFTPEEKRALRSYLQQVEQNLLR